MKLGGRLRALVHPSQSAPELPRDHDQCGWIAPLGRSASPRRLAGVERAHCAVVGGGFTGLAIARQLARRRPDWRIVLLDARRAGFAASGRNSGILVDVGHYQEGLGVEGNQRLVRLARSGIDELHALAREHAIDCAWNNGGRLHGAAADVGLRQLERHAEHLNAMGEPFEWLDAPALASITGTSHYRAAIHTEGSATVQPAALARGLAATLPGNVELFEESPVCSVSRGAPLRLKGVGGEIVTDRAFLATNGFTPKLGFLRRRVFPLVTFGSLTQVLDDTEQEALGGEREWALAPEERMGTTIRRTSDQRILVRNTVAFRPSLATPDRARQRVREFHREIFETRFPMLPNVDLEYTWHGVMGMTMNTMHFFGKLGENLYGSGAYNGVGVAMGTAAGRLLADLALEAESPLLTDMLRLPGPSWIPPQPLLGIGVRATLSRLQSRARAEL